MCSFLFLACNIADGYTHTQGSTQIAAKGLWVYKICRLCDRCMQLL